MRNVGINTDRLPSPTPLDEEQRRLLKMQEYIEENAHALLPILVDLHFFCDLKTLKIMNGFFKPESTESKETAQARITTWLEVKRFIEGLVCKRLKEEFHASRRSRC